MGLALGVLAYYHGVTTMLSPEMTIAGTTVIAQTIFINALPLFTESILVLRVLTVYPLRRTSRLTLMIVGLSTFWYSGLRGFLPFWREETLLLLRNSFGTFLSKRWNGLKLLAYNMSEPTLMFFFRQSRHVDSRIEQLIDHVPASYSKRISTLFWIAVSNFVFPVMLSFVQLVFAFKARLFLDATYIIITNIYFEIIAVLLATVWSAGSKWSEKQQATAKTSTLTLPRFTAGLISTSTPASSQGDSTVAVYSRSAIFAESTSLGNGIGPDGYREVEVKHDRERQF
ncbi:hypothetical protein ARMSODRAFT_974311 [Armillaria solidipes]|uniref:Uncharacterized protein n=1 Tax=Armillaria solidipes TaxID=1076256 RepID=A0A2H3C0I5_9AGAR|nr:hypothetical protein ARMSODRAFT_974311 [Armillaria solidipes]